jgi:hypothetical protein
MSETELAQIELEIRPHIFRETDQIARVPFTPQTSLPEDEALFCSSSSEDNAQQGDANMRHVSITDNSSNVNARLPEANSFLVSSLNDINMQTSSAPVQQSVSKQFLGKTILIIAGNADSHKQSYG